MEFNRIEDQTAPDRGRREILEYLLGFSVFSTLVGVFTPIVGYLVPPTAGSASGGGRVPVGTTKDIPIGKGKVVPVGNKPVIVINTNHGVRAFSAICTHLGCICTWDQSRNIILCPCHDGQFNPVTGAVIAGPPPTPLPAVTVSVDGDEIYVGEA
ncbi:MAG: ubiquinol-cytochrome c reductase iron-sulfur subunit [Anaerolineae bacterium]